MAPRTPKKIKVEPVEENSSYSYQSDDDEEIKPVKQKKITECFKQKKRLNRFDGLSDEEVMKKTLPDHLESGLDIVIIGINPGLFAAYKGHHYAGPGNHFWKCLYLSGLIPTPMNAMDDFKLLDMGIGFTNIVMRATKGSADLSKKELREGATVLIEKLKQYKPKIAVFNGKMIYETFTGKKKFGFGVQADHLVDGTDIKAFVMPSSSARCAQLPRAIDKVPFYIALKKYRDHIKGIFPGLDLNEVTFPDVKLKIETKDYLYDEQSNLDTLKCNEPMSTVRKTFKLEERCPIIDKSVESPIPEVKHEETRPPSPVNVFGQMFEDDPSQLNRLNPFLEQDDNASVSPYFQQTDLPLFGDSFGVDQPFGFQPIWYGRPTAQPVSPIDHRLLGSTELKQEIMD